MIEKIIKNIYSKAEKLNRQIRIMELCGTHSQTVAQYGIKDVLPPNIKLLSGPGCPVCVTDQEDIDIVCGLALAGIPVVSYGDAVRVPGNLMSLEEARQRGAKVYIVYDVKEALEIQKKEPNLIFWGLGFETTTPMTAWGMKNGLCVFSSHKIFPPAMKALLQNKEIKIDGFINPGHVSAIIGTNIYHQFKVPQVVAGFTGEDVLVAIDRLLDQIIEGEMKVENQYGRVVKETGNKKAQELIGKIFTITDSRWRGLGMIKKSGLEVRKEFDNQNAKYLYRDLIKKIKSEIKIKPSACRCHLVLQGIIEPEECPLFGKVCNPDEPYGACMVSVEGACNIDFRYRL